MDPAAAASPECAICLEMVVPKPVREAEKPRVLDCSHIFHRECIGEWIKKKDHCPMCRATIVDISEAPRKDMSPEQILALDSVPDEQVLRKVREVIWMGRRVRPLDLNENTQVAQTARKVNAIAAGILFRN